MAFAKDDSVLDLNRDAGYVSHLKSRIAAQERHMEWLQDNLSSARQQRRLSLIVAGLAVAACLVMFASWGGAA